MNKIYSLIFILALLACSNNKETYFETTKNVSATIHNDSLYVINLDTAQARDIRFSELFSKVHYIPLETNERSLIGRINQICEKGDTLFILDGIIAKKVYAFNKKGKFLFQVGERGNGPGEYLTPTTIGINGQNFYIYDSGKKQILFYDLYTSDFSHAFKLNLQTENRYVALFNGEIYSDAYDFNKTNPFLIQSIDSITGKSSQQWLVTRSYNLGIADPHFFTGEIFFYHTPTGLRYHQMFTDTIIQINQKGVSPYACLHTKNWVKRENLTEYIEGRTTPNHLMISGIYNIHNYVEWGKYLSFAFSIKNYYQVVIYNKEKRQFLLTKDVWIDDLVFKNDFKNIRSIPILGNEKGLYAYIHPMEMYNFTNAVRQGLVHIPKEEKNIFENLQEDNNHIIIYYE